MRDANSEDAYVNRVTPFIVGGLCLLAILTDGGLFAGLLVCVAFFVGWSVANKRLPFGRTLEERRALGREVLSELEENRLLEVLAVVNRGRKLEAIKMIRAEKSDGLAEAKEAVELLADFGLRWSDSKNKPPK